MFLIKTLLKLFVKNIAYHFPRRTIHYENPLISGKVNRQHNVCVYCVYTRPLGGSHSPSIDQSSPGNLRPNYTHQKQLRGALRDRVQLPRNNLLKKREKYIVNR